MKLSCGTDIVEIKRIESAINSQKDRFLNKVYTESEAEYCYSRGKSCYQSFAVRFCAKEAVAKAFGTGIARGIALRDIEVAIGNTGKPFVILHGEAKNYFESSGATQIEISLSHSDEYATAMCIII